MLACGTECQPTEIRREIQLFESSCRPARVDTDDGDGVIKGMGNPAGTTVLVSELVAAELGRWFKLSIPPFAIVRNCQIEIPMRNHNGFIQPPMFFSQWVDGTPRDGGNTFLRRLAHPSDIARLVVFDTWIRNDDRYLQGSPNSENLLYSTAPEPQKYRLVPIDHSHCFVDVDFETDFPAADLITDPAVYGLFPEFEPYMHPAAVTAAIDDLQRLNREFVVECINSIPAEWGISAVHQDHLAELICLRAEFVVNSLPIKLVPDPQLPGLGVER